MVQELQEGAAERHEAIRARVVIAADSGAVEQLTYAVPPALAGRLCAGHRVLVPMRTRRVTGIVLEVGAGLDTGGATPRPILELLEARPLFDGPHLALIEFLASYYMTSLGEAYRSVIPATARVESRRLFHAGTPPSPLAAATFTPLEGVIVAALARRPQALRELHKLGEGKAVDAALNRLMAEGLAEQREATRGRHRGGLTEVVRLTEAAGQTANGKRFRGGVQRAITERLSAAGAGGLSVERLAAEVPGAKLALRRLLKAGAVEMIALHGIGRGRGAARRATLLPRRPSRRLPSRPSRSPPSHRRSASGDSKPFYCGGSRAAARPRSTSSLRRRRSRPAAR